MMINHSDQVNLDLNALAAQLHLDKELVVGDFSAVERVTGHFCDYLDSSNGFVTLCAIRDSNLLLWKSDASQLAGHPEHSEGSPDPLRATVTFKLAHNDLSQCIDIGELEPWSARNGCILYKSKEEIKVTYHFTLFNSHQVTGELNVAPVIYFAGNPSFKIDTRDSEVVRQLIKMTPIVLEIKKNQIICFDKYHYQFAYSNDFYFIRVNNANRVN